MAEDTSVPPRSAMPSDPIARMARSRHEFGEHGGVNLSIETSSTFTVLEAGKMPEMFGGRAGPKGGCFLYGRHFNPTVMVLSRLLAALEATPSAYCTASGMAAISGSLLQACDTITCRARRASQPRSWISRTSRRWPARSRRAPACSTARRCPTPRCAWRTCRRSPGSRTSGAPGSLSTTPSRRSPSRRRRTALTWSSTALPSSSTAPPTSSRAASARTAHSSTSSMTCMSAT